MIRTIPKLVQCLCGGSLWCVEEFDENLVRLSRPDDPENNVEVQRPYFDADFKVWSWQEDVR